MKILCAFGRDNYGRPARGEGYEYVNFIPALQALGHEVRLLDTWDRTRQPSFVDLNRELLETAERERPEVVFSVLMHYEIWSETWEILRDSGMVTTINWATDDSWKYRQFSRLVADRFHAFASTCPDAYDEYRRAGLDGLYPTQWAASDAQLARPLPASECRYRVTFVGTNNRFRQAWVDALERAGVAVACFGHGWPAGAIAAGDIPRIIRESVISLNFASGATTWNGLLPRSENQIKARVFEIPGAGGFLLTESATHLERYFEPGREIEVFRTPGELAAKIHTYLSRPELRDRVAQAGHLRIAREHTYRRRFAGLLDFAARRRAEHLGRIPGRGIDWRSFEEAVIRHRTDPWVGAAMGALRLGCTAVWGRARGPRAARRLLTELEWRLAGDHLYSAAGWPGRYFYEQS
jgi:spore maturation protein CgeB